MTVTETRTEIPEHANKQPPRLYPLILIHAYPHRLLGEREGGGALGDDPDTQSC